MKRACIRCVRPGGFGACTRTHAHTRTQTRMHTNTHTLTHTHTNTHMYTNTHTCTLTHTHACTATHTDAHTRTHTHTHAHTDTHSHTHTRTHTLIHAKSGPILETLVRARWIQRTYPVDPGSAVLKTRSFVPEVENTTCSRRKHTHTSSLPSPFQTKMATRLHICSTRDAFNSAQISREATQIEVLIVGIRARPCPAGLIPTHTHTHTHTHTRTYTNIRTQTSVHLFHPSASDSSQILKGIHTNRSSQDESLSPSRTFYTHTHTRTETYMHSSHTRTRTHTHMHIHTLISLSL